MHTIIALSFLMSLFSPLPNAQVPLLDAGKYVIAPPEKYLLMTASQAECPLQLEKFRLLLAVTRGEQPEFEFKIRNVGTKSIIRYTVSYRTSLSTGGTLGGGQSLTKPILPGEIVSGFQKNFQVVPLSDEIRVRIGLDKKEQMLVVLMVEKVVFDDGSSFDAAVTSQAFFDYFLEKTKF